MDFQALPRLTNREKVVEMVDPALKGHYSKKDLIQVNSVPITQSYTLHNYETIDTQLTLFSCHCIDFTDSCYCSHVCTARSRLSTSND